MFVLSEAHCRELLGADKKGACLWLCPPRLRASGLTRHGQRVSRHVASDRGSQAAGCGCRRWQRDTALGPVIRRHHGHRGVQVHGQPAAWPWVPVRARRTRGMRGWSAWLTQLCGSGACSVVEDLDLTGEVSAHGPFDVVRYADVARPTVYTGIRQPTSLHAPPCPLHTVNTAF